MIDEPETELKTRPAEPAEPSGLHAGEVGDLRWKIRPAVQTDLRFIGSSWRRNYSLNPITRCPGGLPEFIRTQNHIIERLTSYDPILVAVPAFGDQGEDDQILGWVAYRRPDVVHYVYVKPYFRRAGVARGLLLAALGDAPPAQVWSSHRWVCPWPEHPIRDFVDHARRRGVAVSWNPMLAHIVTREEPGT